MPPAATTSPALSTATAKASSRSWPVPSITRRHRQGHVTTIVAATHNPPPALPSLRPREHPDQKAAHDHGPPHTANGHDLTRTIHRDRKGRISVIDRAVDCPAPQFCPIEPGK